ncbi:MAG: 16S rRNA (guanine(527)-N(7))-methyltransferase RsmG [Paracoccaceae bacterium]
MLGGDVSRETQARLETLAALVHKWNSAVNLVAKSTLDDIKARHIDDSLQILQYAPPDPSHWVDLGSGGGFPGLVVAAALATTAPRCNVTLIEADGRKSVFLREAARTMGLHVTVITNRIEAVEPQGADVISARALAPLPALCGLISRHLLPSGTAVLLKGRTHDEELRQSVASGWQFDATHHKSVSDGMGVVLVLRNLTFVSAT